MPIYKMDGKKDGKQQYRVRINYTDAQGKSKQIDRVAYGNAEAKILEMELNKEMKNKTITSNKTIQELYYEYIEVKRHEVRETSLDKTQRILSAYILPELGIIKLNKLNVQVLQKWKTYISELDTKSGENKKLAIRTRKNIFGEFRAFLNYAVKMEYIVKNPLIMVGNFKDACVFDNEINLQYYTVEQFKIYIETCKGSCTTLGEWGYYVFFNIAFYTGMRKGEINALKWSDIEGNILHVRRSIAQKLKGGDRETPPKNKSSYRDLQMPLPLIKILNEHKARQEMSEDFSEDFRVCGGIGCLRDTSLSNKNIEIAKKCDLSHIRIHDFRHSHATLLVNEGINIQEIARRLGHSKIETTWNTYAHLYPREEERAVAILNNI